MPVVAVSVNQAKVDPTSIARQTAMASTLVSNALFVFLLFIFFSSYVFSAFLPMSVTLNRKDKYPFT